MNRPLVDRLHDESHGQFRDGDTRAAFAAGFRAAVHASKATAHATHVIGQIIGVPIDATELIETVLGDTREDGASHG